MTAKYIEKLLIDLYASKIGHKISFRINGVDGFKYTFNIRPNGSNTTSVNTDILHNVMIIKGLAGDLSEYHIDCSNIAEISVKEI